MNSMIRSLSMCLLFFASFPWQVQAQFVPNVKRFFQTRPTPIKDSGFGSVIATNGTVVAAGDPLFSTVVNGFSATERGTVRLFSSSAGVFTRTIEPPPSDAAISLLRFGTALAMFGNTLAVGAPQSPTSTSPINASVYLFNASNGRLIAKIQGSSPGFGTSVAMHGDLLVVGSPREDSDRGATYVYSVSTQTELARLTAADRALGDAFGTSVAVSPYYIAVGAPLDDTARGVNAGSGYLFDALGPFKQIRKLTDETVVLENRTTAEARLGSSIALCDQQIFLGAPGGTVAAQSASGFVIGFIANRPTKLVQLLTVPEQGQRFGSSLAGADDLLVAGPTQPTSGTARPAIFSVSDWDQPQPADGAKLTGFSLNTKVGAGVAVHGNTVVAITEDISNPSSNGVILQLSPITRPILPGGNAFIHGRFAPGLAGANISNSLVQLQDTTISHSYELLTLTGPGSAGGRTKGIWDDSAAQSPALLQSQDLGAFGLVRQISSFRVGGGNLVAQIKRAGAGFTGSRDDLILALLPGQAPFPAFAEGDPLPGGGLGGPTFKSFSAYALSDAGAAAAVGFLNRSSSAGVAANSDSFFALNQIASPLPSPLPAREGAAFASVTLGQIAPRLAAGGNDAVYTAAISGPTGQNQGAFRFAGNGTGTLIARKGDNGREANLEGEVFNTFLAESMNENGAVALRATLTGGGVTAADNEALYAAAAGSPPNICLRKGDQAPGLPAGVRIASFLSFQSTSAGGSILVLARVKGPGVNSSNDVALFVDSTNLIIALPPGTPVIPSHVLLREGDLLPGGSKATIRTILRVAYDQSGGYMVLVSLVARAGEATAANNLALLYGESRFTEPAATDAAGYRRPFLIIRKGTPLADAGGLPVKSMSFFAGTITAGGASGTGMGSIAGNSLPLWLLDFGRGIRAIHRGGFNN
ncbi:MAG: FG-GAP repeat protein [Verrucomicrobiales bacterium]|nr:FG-GAP repeat protein [Verrucomicrobiales bacterium]MCP5557341.1 FG-GAP repeat protein [Verrucomicrobiaceae bacterium]